MPSDFVRELILEEEANIRIEHKISAIHDTIKSKIPEGVSDNLTVAVTDIITDLRPSNTKSMPWMSFSMLNDGPDGVHVVINEKTTTKAPVKKGEALDADLLAQGKIYRLWLYCEKGKTASVRIYALR